MGSNIIIVSPLHNLPVPLVYNLGETTLIITDSYDKPEAFELVTPRVELVAPRGTNEEVPPTPDTVILSHEETYFLHQCLTVLFGETGKQK